MTNYQVRMKRFIWFTSFYSFLCPAAIWYYSIGALGWIVFASTLALLACLAVACDAVFDSRADQAASRTEVSKLSPAA